MKPSCSLGGDDLGSKKIGIRRVNRAKRAGSSWVVGPCIQSAESCSPESSPCHWQLCVPSYGGSGCRCRGGAATRAVWLCARTTGLLTLEMGTNHSNTLSSKLSMVGIMCAFAIELYQNHSCSPALN